MGVHNDVSHSFSKSGSEVSEALLAKNDSEADRDSIDSTPRERNVERSARRWNLYIVLSFAVFNIAVLIAIYFVLAGRSIATPTDRAFPQREYETLVFKPQSLRPGPKTDAEWDAAGPKGSGYLIVDDPEGFGLPRGLQYHPGGGDRIRYGVTWAHQFHCLRKLQAEYWKMVGNDSTLIGKSLEDDDPDSVYLWHLAHCFDYLKQTIICSMDMTLEYPTKGGVNVINGYEIPHQCTKRSVYDHYMEEHAPTFE